MRSYPRPLNLIPLLSISVSAPMLCCTLKTQDSPANVALYPAPSAVNQSINQSYL